MRRGLIVVGVAVALVGVGVLIIAFGVSPGASTSDVFSVNAPTIDANQSFSHVIVGVLQKTATVVYGWSSSHSVKVNLYVALACADNLSRYCPAGPALKSWWDTSGVYSYTAAVVGPWLVQVNSTNGTATSFNSTLVETYVNPPAFGLSLDVYVLLAASIVLVGIGALALFLGLFLRGGIYDRAPPRLTPPPDSSILGQGAGDLEDDPLDEIPGDEPDDD